MTRHRRTAFLMTIIAAGFFAFADDSHAANWYVDNAVATSGNGRTWATAWKEFSNIVWGNSGVKEGDTLYISGGPASTSKTYTSTLTVGASGASGAPITIRAGQDAGHNGEVILDFDSLGDSATASGIAVTNCSYIVIDGSAGTARKLTIKNLRNTAPGNGWLASAIDGNGSSHITIKFVNVDNCNNGFRATYGTGYDVNNCRLTGMRGDSAISFLASTGMWDTNIIHDNHIGLVVANTDGGGPDGIQNGNGVSIYNNTFRVDRVAHATSSQHPDYMQNQGNYIKIYNNDFINIGDSGFDMDMGYGASAPHDIWIYNNTFRIVDQIDTYPEYIGFYNCQNAPEGSITNLKVMNNVFLDNPSWTNFYINCANASTTASGIEIKNNIWYNSGLDGYRLAWSFAGAGFTNASFDIDYNLYYGGAYVGYLDTTYTASNWLSSHEPHSSVSRPAFVSYSAYNTNNNLRLSASDSAAKDHGVSLSSYFTTDKNGFSRPQGSAWDIGAHEYFAAPAAPTGLTVQ